MDWDGFFRILISFGLIALFVGSIVWRVKRQIAQQMLFQQQLAAMAQLMAQAQNSPNGGLNAEQQQEFSRRAAQAQATLSALGRINRQRSEVVLGDMMSSASAAGFTNFPRL